VQLRCIRIGLRLRKPISARPRM